MKGMLEILRLELKALVRSKTVMLLLFGCIGWMLLMPHVVHGDGTVEGAREIAIAYSMGGVFALVVLSLVASSTATLAKEREAKRLQLTQIRPVRYFAIALGKLVAHVLVGAAVLVVSAAVLACRVDSSVPCRHVLKPLLPTPMEEAKEMYSSYMEDPGTPEYIRKSPKAAVLRILEMRAIDHYQTIPTNQPVAWRFAGDGDAVRLRLTNRMEMRQEAVGLFRSNGSEVSISNMTQSVTVVPFAGVGPELEFINRGGSTLMLRPRKDVEILRAADGFLMNLVRAVIVLTAVLALILSFAVLLSAGLGRPVALFTVISFLLLGLMSPSVVEQYPDELSASFADRIGLELTRFAATVTRPFAAYSPIEPLSKDECIEYGELLRAVAVDSVAVPLLLVFLSAFILPRKQDGV